MPFISHEELIKKWGRSFSIITTDEVLLKDGIYETVRAGDYYKCSICPLNLIDSCLIRPCRDSVVRPRENTIYYQIVFVPEDAMVGFEDDIIWTTKLGILSDKYPIEEYMMWKDLDFCRVAYERDPNYIQYFNLDDDPKRSILFDDIYQEWPEGLLLCAKSQWIIEVLKRRPDFIRGRYKQTRKIQQFIVDFYPSKMKYIVNPDREMLYSMLTRDPSLIELFKIADRGLLLSVIERRPGAILYINSPSYDMYKLAIQLDWTLLRICPVRIIIRLMCQGTCFL